MSLAIHQFRDGDDRSSEAVTAFLEQHGGPIVEGVNVTFVFRGSADAIYLQHFISGLPTRVPFERLRDTDLWFCIVQLPHGSRVEYKFSVERGGNRRWIRDPLNPNLARDPFGANSVCQAEGYSTGDWIEHDPEAREGELREVVLSPTPFDEPRRVTMYTPARFRTSRRYHVLIVHDGGDYLRYSRMKTVLDNLIHRGEVQPLIVAFTHPSDRLVEYPDHAPHQRFLVESLLP
jgi:enterochelin esterase family protein